MRRGEQGWEAKSKLDLEKKVKRKQKCKVLLEATRLKSQFSLISK